ncbi:MAG: glycoside hydrolase family 127 protein [Bifidobacteriaceae bacterium]|nr:glycoside hydrolase family 127 protein [Bifidobacteriaceae bacterium]
MPVPSGHVKLTGGFWAGRQAVNSQASIPHCLKWLERTGWLSHFDRTARAQTGPRPGPPFSDSEVYKVLEALAWEIGRTGDQELDGVFTALTARVLGAQSGDGYLNTHFGGPGQPDRYSDLEWGHELYCSGHLIQAGIARARTCGLEDPFVCGMLRVADHVVREFGPDGRQAICGHPEIETALAELARVTGDERYLRQAKLFIERRGHGSLMDRRAGRAYFQDDVPVRDARAFRGHAVRSLYLAAGAVDVAVETGDGELLAAVRHQWSRTIARRTYLTGGMGSRHDWESFGDDFELPSDRAYCETCAAIGSVMVGWRLLLATGDENYADQIERALFNVVAASPDAAGTSFFYVNPLRRVTPGVPALEDEPSARAASSQRAPWFDVPCCPTNIARMLAALTGYVASTDTTGVRIHQYAPALIAATLPDGALVRLRLATEYPLNGLVDIDILDAPDREWALSLRVPPWARGRSIIHSPGRLEPGDGRMVVRGRFSTGDRVRLELPVEPRFTFPDPRVDATRGCVAVEAGPLVYCLESIDAPPSHDLAAVVVDPQVAPERAAGDFVTVATRVAGLADGPWACSQSAVPSVGRSTRVSLIPYHRWAERGPSTMRVWLPAGPGPAQ